MKGYDIIEALGEAADEYVEEAEQRGELKRADTGCRVDRAAGRKEKNGFRSHHRHTLVLKAAAACALLLVLPAATVLAVDYFSTLKGDELALTNDHFLFGQDWQCMVDFQNATEEWIIYRAENEEEGDLHVNDKPVNPLREESDNVPEVPEMYLAADLLKEHSGDSSTDSVSSGLMVPVFIAFNGAVYGGYDYDISEDYLIVSDRLVEFNPSYTYTAYQVVGRPGLVAIIINGGYAVYQKVSDVVFSIGGDTYQVECPAGYLGEGVVGEQIGERDGMKIYRAVNKENQEVIEGKCIIDISELMSDNFPHLFGSPEENYADCRWVAAVVE